MVALVPEVAMGPRVRWLLFWYLVPAVVVFAAATLAGHRSWFQQPVIPFLVSVAPAAGYLGWWGRRHGLVWWGPLGAEAWSAWLPSCTLLVLGYFFLLVGGEPTWSRLWGPWLAQWGFPPATSVLGSDGTGLTGAFLLVFTVTVVPFVEESLFRGALLGQWSRWWGPIAAVAGTSLLFGAIHDQGQVFKMVLGVGLAALALRSGSTLVPMTAHALVNLLAVGTFLAAGSSPSTDDPNAPAPEVEGFLFFTGCALLAWFGRTLVKAGLPPPYRYRRTKLRPRLKFRASGPALGFRHRQATRGK